MLNALRIIAWHIFRSYFHKLEFQNKGTGTEAAAHFERKPLDYLCVTAMNIMHFCGIINKLNC